MKNSLTRKLEFFSPLVILLAGSLLCQFSDFDMEVSALFFDSATGDWPWLDNPAVRFGNKYGPKFSAVFFVLACLRLIVSYINPRKAGLRSAAIFVILCFLLGPIVIVNGAAKKYSYRPRPREVIEFGGRHPHTRVFSLKNRSYDGSSFPSGHAAGGFILVCLYFAAKRESRAKALSLLALGLGTGIWMSATRIVSGAHFFSDTLWSFGVSWYVCYFLYYNKWSRGMRRPFSSRDLSKK